MLRTVDFIQLAPGLRFLPSFFRVFIASDFEMVRFRCRVGELSLFQLFFVIAMWIILSQTCYR